MRDEHVRLSTEFSIDADAPGEALLERIADMGEYVPPVPEKQFDVFEEDEDTLRERLKRVPGRQIEFRCLQEQCAVTAMRPSFSPLHDQLLIYLPAGHPITTCYWVPMDRRATS